MKYKPFSSRVQLYITYIFRSVYKTIKGDVHMTNQEIKKYKKENCSKCTKNIDCKIIRRVDGKLTCTEEE